MFHVAGGMARLGAELHKLFRLAALVGSPAAIRLHLARGENVNSTDKDGCSPLLLAASRGQLAACLTLLEAGADITLRNLSGRDALSAAREAGHEAVVSALVAFLQAQQGRTPESCAADAKSTESGLELEESDWEAEPELVRPAGDASCIEQACELQALIAAHVPIDSDMDWSDVDLALPAIPAMRHVQASAALAIRDVLAAASIKGRLAASAAESVCTQSDDEIDAELLRQLRMVLSDLGIAIDDEADLLGADVALDVPDHEDDAVWQTTDEALELLQRLQAPECSPLHLYSAEITRWSLLTRDDEQRLGACIEQSVRDALSMVMSRAMARECLKQRIEAILIGKVEVEECFVISARDDALSDEVSPHDRSSSESTASDSEAQTEEEAPELPELIDLSRELDDSHVPAEQLIESIVPLGISWTLIESLADEAIEGKNDPLPDAVRSVLETARGARRTLVESNLRLVLSIAKHYTGSGMPLSDLVQEGNLGLMRAVTRFEYRRGYKFSTYATWWIRQAITRSIGDKRRHIRIPIHMLERMRHVEKTATALEAKAGRVPSVRELAETLGVPMSAIWKMRQIPEDPVMFSDCEADNAADETEADDACAVYMSIAAAEPGPAYTAVAVDLKRNISRALSCLTPVQQRIIRLRFGIGEESEHTLEEVGRKFDRTRERIRQIESKALERLRKMAHLNSLEDFVNYARETRPLQTRASESAA